MALTPEQQIAGLRAQLQAIQSRPPGSTAGGGGTAQRQSQQAQQQWLQQQYAINSQIQNLSNAAQSGGAGGADQAQRNQDEILGLARGDISRFQGDTVDEMLLSQLRGRVEGGGPYNEEVRNSLLTQAGESAAAVQANDLARIQGGGNASDPSVQSQVAEANARRQAALQQAQLGIGQVANLANYNAQGQALNQLGNFNQGRQQGLSERERYLNSLLGQINYTQEQGGGGGGGYAGGGYQAPPASYFMPQQQPQTYTPPTPPRPTSGGSSGGGLVVAPRTPDMSGWTPAQRAAYTGQAAPAPQAPPAGGYQHADILNARGTTWTASGPAGTRTGQNGLYQPPVQQTQQQVQQPTLGQQSARINGRAGRSTPSFE